MKRILVTLFLALSILAGSFALLHTSFTRAAGTGSLSGTEGSQPTLVNLTTEGTLDWVYWYNVGTTIIFEHKSTATQSISNYTVVGKNPVSFAKRATVFKWTDGTPKASGFMDKGLYVAGLNNGFQLTVPASTSPQTLKVYVGVTNAQGKLTATLSDNSASSYTDSSLNITSGTELGMYTITYNAASSGQTLNITFIVQAKQPNVTSRVILQAATLH
jgi:hypothetical protein